jgi:RNA 2',3'-cyclic 3'-phosphodiesterase
MEIRSFLAFELPPDIRAVVSLVQGEMRGLPGVRWVNVHNIHLTVVFLGNIAVEHVKPMGKTAAAVCSRYRPFEVSVGRTGFFGSRRHPRVLWIGLKGDLERMAGFRDELQAELEPFGIRPEKRPFRPHLTLGRFRGGGNPGPRMDEMLSRYSDLQSPACRLEELVLFRSELRPEGALYSVLRTCPLSEKG